MSPACTKIERKDFRSIVYMECFLSTLTPFGKKKSMK